MYIKVTSFVIYPNFGDEVLSKIQIIYMYITRLMMKNQLLGGFSSSTLLYVNVLVRSGYRLYRLYIDYRLYIYLFLLLGHC